MIEGACHCGAVRWRIDTAPDSATACNCTSCRRYGALWAYGHDGVDVHLSGATHEYRHGEQSLGFHFCGTCGGLAYWRGTKPAKSGHTRVGVNLRMADPKAVAAIPLHHLDGLDSWKTLPVRNDCVADFWF